MIRRRLRRIASTDRAELVWRARCAGRAFAQRARFAWREPQWDRARLYSRLAGTTELSGARAALRKHDWRGAHEALQRHFVTRPPHFVLSPSARDAFAASVEARYPGASADAAARGNRLLTGARDLLGYQGLVFSGDWHRDPVTGRRAPLVLWNRVPFLDPGCGDHKVIWEVNRHQHWLAWGRAYWLTGDGAYRDAFVEELAGWLRANPPLVGINWASMLELAFRTLAWVWSLHFFARIGDQERQPWTVDLLLGIDAQLGHIEHNLSYYFSPNTHLLGEALALYIVGRALPEFAASPRRAALGRQILVTEAARQVAADGFHCERSTHYHRYTLDFYLQALAVARASADPIAAAFERVVHRLADAARLLAGDDGRAPHIGDDDGGMLMPIAGRAVDDWRDSLAAAAAMTGDEALQVGDAPEETAWLTGVVPSRLVPAAKRIAPVASRALPDAGYYVSRVAGQHHLVIDGGPHGYRNCGHAHADALALTLSVRDVPLLIDAGTACYTVDARLRDRFRSTAAHNTLQLDDRPQSIGRGPFHWSKITDAVTHRWRSTGGFDLFDGSHDGYAPSTHRRRVAAIHAELIVVVDSVLGTGWHNADVHWHLGERWSASVQRRRVDLTTPDDSVRLFVPDGRVDAFAGDSATGLGWHSPAYGVVAPTTTIRIRRAGAAPFTVASVFDLNQIDPVEDVEWLPVWSEAGTVTQSAALRITRHDCTDFVLFVEPADPVAHGRWRLAEFETDARMLYYRVDRAGGITCLALADGSYVRAAGRRAFALALGRPVPALMIDEFTIGTYTPCAASPGL